MAESALLQAIQKASADDLRKTDERIAELTRELDSLKAVRRVLDVRLNGKPEKVAKPRAINAKASELAEQIHDLISANGSMPVHVIAARLSVKPQSVAACVTRSNWFRRTPEGEVAIA